jgi:NAD(P)-dependent dehydrogenase (short-subunit alcohol dehydrogenase family)
MHMKNNCLKGKCAIVTGGRRGIGKAIALALAEEGADVAVCDIIVDDGLLSQTKAELDQRGSRAPALKTDISLQEDVWQLMHTVTETFGRIDILVNSAGVWIPGQTLIECGHDDWDRVIDTNLKGTFLCCRAAGKIMVRQKSGSIINVSSQVGLTPGAGAGAYPISKAGIVMLTRQLALELACHNIRVNALAPGIVKTDFNSAFWKEPEVEKKTAGMVPLKRLAEAEDVARAALFLASDNASYITGEVLCINGGWHPCSDQLSAAS